MDMDGNSESQSQKVRYGLSHLDAQQTETSEEYPHRWDEEDALTGGGEEGSRDGAADGLLHHVAHDDPALGREADALEPQCRRTAFYDRRIIPEQPDELGGENKHQRADAHQKAQRGLDAEPEALPHPVI